MNKTALGIVAIFSLGILNVNAQTIDVKLDGLVKEAIKRNSNLIFDRIQSEIIKNQADVEKNIFIPQAYSNFTHQSSNTPNNTEQKISRNLLENYEEDTNNLELGLKGLINTGGSWNFAFKTNDKESSLIDKYDYNKEYTNIYELTLRQPLLKGFGKDVTLARYNLVKAEQKIFNREYEKKMLDLIGNVIQYYWKLYGLKDLQKSYEESIILSEKSLLLLESKFEAGDVSLNELLEAKGSIFSKKAELRRVNSDIISAKNSILNILNVPEDKNENLVFNLIDTPMSSNRSLDLTLKEYYNKAILNWPEYQIAKEKLNKEGLNIKYVENSIEPQFDIVSSVTTTKLEDSRAYGVDERFISWNFGFEFSIPLDNSQQKSSLHMAKLKKEQILVEINTLRKRLYNAISDKYTSYLNSKDQVELYNYGLELKEKLLKNIRIGFKFGNNSVKEVILQENDILEHKRKLFSSIIDWELSEASLQKAIGRLFN